MKDIKFTARCRLARIKTKRIFRKVTKGVVSHPYIYGTIFFLFILVVSAALPSAERISSSNVNSISTQYKKGSIADLDAARTRAADEGKELKVIDLTKKAPAILDQVPVK